MVCLQNVRMPTVTVIVYGLFTECQDADGNCRDVGDSGYPMIVIINCYCLWSVYRMSGR